MLENKVFRIMFVLKDKVSEEFGILHNEKYRDLERLPGIRI
jgi:hypothetical protein